MLGNQSYSYSYFLYGRELTLKEQAPRHQQGRDKNGRPQLQGTGHRLSFHSGSPRVAACGNQHAQVFEEVVNGDGPTSADGTPLAPHFPLRENELVISCDTLWQKKG